MGNNRVASENLPSFGTNSDKSLFPAHQGTFSVPKPDSKLEQVLEQVLEQPVGVWIYQHPELMSLAWTFYCLALEYKLRWAAFWPERWDDWAWVKMAMEQTFAQLNPEDQSGLQEFYAAFLQKVEYYDEITML